MPLPPCLLLSHYFLSHPRWWLAFLLRETEQSVLINLCCLPAERADFDDSFPAFLLCSVTSHPYKRVVSMPAGSLCLFPRIAVWRFYCALRVEVLVCGDDEQKHSSTEYTFEENSIPSFYFTTQWPVFSLSLSLCRCEYVSVCFFKHCIICMSSWWAQHRSPAHLCDDWPNGNLSDPGLLVGVPSMIRKFVILALRGRLEQRWW